MTTGIALIATAVDMVVLYLHPNEFSLLGGMCLLAYVFIDQINKGERQ